jgi:hypothetical protein
MTAPGSSRPDRDRGLSAWSALGLGLLLAGATWGEGAVKTLDCAVARVCDAGGRCETGTGRVSFRMEPEELEAGGAGRYTLSYGDTRAEMEAMSDAGPFFWSVGRERDALLASSETEFLWHRLALEPVPEATIRFLTCSFQQ